MTNTTQNGNGTGRDARVARILNNLRHHLEDALANDAIKRLVFTFELNNGGVRRSDIDVGVQYTYVNTLTG